MIRNNDLDGLTTGPIPDARAAPYQAGGERVRRARRRRGMTLAVTAGLIGKPTSWLSMIENGKRELSRLDDIFALAAVLRVPVPELTGFLCPGCPEGGGERGR